MIDVNFDFQVEADGRDSDRYSPTLQEYHRVLWSKPLPNGELFNLTKISNNRLYHNSNIGEFYLSSDRAVATFSTWKRLQHIIPQIPDNEIADFVKLSDSIGGIVIWPSNKINNLPTINGERGFNSKIADRLDLTVECIRRYYLGLDSPLYETFKRYTDFFELFNDFKGYIDFFLLQDLVSSDYSEVKISAPYDDFNSLPIPRNVVEYVQYMESTSEVIKNRNIRISEHSKSLTHE
jgi:hypothetical protein